MTSEDREIARINRYLLEAEEDEDLFEDDTGQSDHDEIDHVSASDHNTDTEADDTDEDPDFDPSVERNEFHVTDSDSDVIPGTDDEEPPVVMAAEDPGNSMDLDGAGSVVEEHVDEVIEAVVRGGGRLVPVLLGKDNETVWKKEPIVAATARARPINIIRRLPGPKNAGKHAKTPLQCFSLMIDDDILEIIVTNTNVYIEHKSQILSRSRDAKPTDKTEIKAFIGLLLLAGVIRSGHQNLSELWGRDGFGIEVFYSTMSLRRFQFLLQSIRFDNIVDRPTRRALDKFAPFREILEKFNVHCNDNYNPCAFTTVDEQLVPFRGRCSFRQFMKSKPAKYGLKIFTLTDSKMFYVIKMEVYVGNQPENSSFKWSNKPKDVVLRLANSIEKTGRNITGDNWFSSIPLVEELIRRGLSYVGTIRKDKRELPPQLVSKKRDEKSSIFAFRDDMTVVSYAPKKNRSVVLISSMHFDQSIDPDSQEKLKPEIVTFYNSTKSGVDVVDEKCGSYSTSRRCLRWPLVLFYRLLDIAGINSQVIYLSNCQGDNDLERRKFLKEVGLELIKPQVQKRATIESLPKTLKSSIRKVASVQQTPQPAVNRPKGTRLRCVVCPRGKDTKTTQQCSKCQRPMCLSHMDTYCKDCQVPNQEVEITDSE